MQQTTMNTLQTIVSFPEIRLQTRDAHKLRGYFGQLFKEHSPILHNHYEDGTSRYRYPLVQYKVIDETPVLVGFNEGAELLVNLFLKIKEINIEGKVYPVLGKNIRQTTTELTPTGKLNRYQFKTLWMALNQKNYAIYNKLDGSEKKEFLDKTLQNNILSYFKGMNYFTTERIMANANVVEKQTHFKDQNMLAFSGDFVTNAVLPDLAGIGKAVSRGFGSVQKI
jgi:restriction endonuclease